MKKLLLLLLCVPLIGFGQWNSISVKTEGSYLNIRENHSASSKIIGKLKNNSEVGYSGEWKNGWIKINNFVSTGHLVGERTTGWVSSDYLNAPNFKSLILDTIDYNDNYVNSQIGRGIAVWENVDGIILVEGWDDIFVKINGKYITLQERKNTKNSLFTEFYSNDIIIKIFFVFSAQYGETSKFDGFMIINYNDLEEIIFISTLN